MLYMSGGKIPLMQHHNVAPASLWASFKLFCNFDLHGGRVYRSHVALDDTGSSWV